jgi:hypothetical protein
VKFIYMLSSIAHQRVFESFNNNNDNLIVGPKPDSPGNHYGRMKIRNICYYQKPGEVQGIVDKFGPDYFIQADFSNLTRGMRLPSKCKRIYVSHGMVGRHVKDMVSKDKWNMDLWRGCDLYCGATGVFKDWIDYVSPGSNVLTNAIPQLDRIFELRGLSTKGLVGYDGRTTIFFGGFCCRDRIDFNDHNEDYFKTCIELERIASRNGWLIVIKPRQAYKKMHDFLTAHKAHWGGWTKQYIEPYAKLQGSPFVKFLNTTCGLSTYYAACDAMVINGCSTMEVESYALGKQLVIVNTKKDALGEFAFTDERDDTCFRVKSMDNLERSVNKALLNPQDKLNNQASFLSRVGITVDGEMHKRVIDRICSL